MIRFLLSALVIAVLPSCSMGFRTQWQAAVAQSRPASSIDGPWEGTWLSGFNGHTGKLSCVVGPEKADHTREFFYHATWGKLFSGSFRAVHEVSQSGGVTHFTAKHDIGKRGTFHAEGTISGSEFKATYKAAGDHGTFVMKRPQGS